jgi:3-hydroxybutyrate dehydrogenase
MSELKGKVAVVTGSTSGIGLGIANSLAEAGCNVMLNGFGDAAAIEATRKELADKHKVEILYSAADMTKPEQIAAMIATAKNELGSVDIVVNNAGIQHVAPVEDFPAAKWDAILAINLSSAFHTIQHALPIMRANNWGRIINVASAHGIVASAQKSAYVAAKHGVNGLTKVVALETATTGITCNSICPGWVLTPLVEQQIRAKAEEGAISFAEAKVNLLAEKQPAQEFVQVDELGALAVFLCGKAAQRMTGAILSMDGGWTAQ